MSQDANRLLLGCSNFIEIVNYWDYEMFCHGIGIFIITVEHYY